MHADTQLGDRSRDIPPGRAKYVYPGKLVSGGPPLLTSEELKRTLLGNPMITGVATFPRFMSDADWVRGAAHLMREDGIEQFLVNMLYLMRHSIQDFVDQ